MRIGLMLRAYDENGGIGVYTRNLVAELLRIDRQNHYVLLFRRRDHLGGFNDYANLDFIHLRRQGKLRHFSTTRNADAYPARRLS